MNCSCLHFFTCKLKIFMVLMSWDECEDDLETIHVGCLAWGLVHSKCSINMSW